MRQLVINIVLAFTLATILVVVVAPIFGYKFDLIVSSLNDLGADESALTSPEVVDPSYGGYAAPTTAQGYRMLPGGSALTSLSALGSRVLNRSDLTTISPAWLVSGGTNHTLHIDTYITHTGAGLGSDNI